MSKHSTILLLGLLVVVTIFVQATGNKAPGPFTSTPVEIKVPAGWPDYNRALFENNPITEEGIALGREFFYDGRLSRDGITSCGNCHQQFSAFANLDHDFSHGVFDSFATRNTQPLFNLVWMKNWNWDGGVDHLEFQPLGPLTKANEMGMTVEEILPVLNADTQYQRMAHAAFGTTKINSSILLKSLTQFMSQMISSNSKYDRVMAGTDSFSRYQADGYVIYKTQCSSCHPEPLFTDGELRNNGRKLNRLLDFGRMGVSGKAADSLKFKVPSLRNLKLTFPYMHDGSLPYLPNVIDYYASLKDAPPQGLDSILIKNPVTLSNRDKMVLIEFLYTLTDDSLMLNPALAPRRFVHIKH